MLPSTHHIVGISSSIARLSAYAFLRWIPGHHFPPIIISSVLVYLIFVFGNSRAFGSHRPTLHEAFPKLFPQPEPEETAAAEDDNPEDHVEPAFYDDEKSFFQIFVLGIPKWREPQWSYMTITVNLLLAIFTLDLVFRGPLLYPAKDLTFSRVGYVDHSSANILIREPDPAQLPIYVYISPADKATWTTMDTIYYLGDETDYTYPITFDGLQPSKKYIYSLSNNLEGTFTTSPAPYSEAAKSLTFLTSSCIKANFPYKAKAHALAIHGFQHLSKVIQSLPSPASFMLFLGDFIYVDVPLRLSSSLRHYRSEYRRVYASPSWSLPGLDTVPWLHTLDDHEIANDWSGGNDTDPFPAASDPFIHYHVSVNPPVPKGSPDGPGTNTTYFQFSNGPASFFMLDTRRYRTDPEPAPAKSKPFYRFSVEPPNPPVPATNHSMLGTAQLESLLRYLSTPEPPRVHWKIVASSVPFTKNWRFGTSDTWGGFLYERSKILEAMHKAERDLGVRVIILSGDRHEFAAIRFPPPIADFAPSASRASKGQNKIIVDQHALSEKSKTTVYDRTASSGPHEFSVGPLSMFYLPFRTFKQIDEEDVAIRYLPDGNSKVGVIDISPLAGEVHKQKSMLRYSLYVDGALSWEYTLTSPAADGDIAGRRGARWWLWS
ncbi:uncharacterized protein A1O9_12374 [Exophiala aquamarina CBS 119918]|uniref:PhoD-like phosphatase metallophosphatase domain-containing protein n=1 Tax=Exophiala aquamarina CBS 119918 TaxID=1182545 RepID=A0A072NVN3_9EURO|nr:uncharacterized protein A1O9_12374 [Exophiala aquamarina CBS 119918]KEF51457.1 hypothetical protein A1O9_12374 [Exophiala aquamarina CBS 119918]